MAAVNVRDADSALARLSAMRAIIPPADFYRQCDRLLDMRLAAALVVKLETEHVELVGSR